MSNDLDNELNAAEEVVPDRDIPSYFQRLQGRLFSSHGNNYPLPVDGQEQDRLSTVHDALERIIGGHYFGPAEAVLTSDQGGQKRVLDIGTGTGYWVLDMAELFPEVLFDGLDIAPIMTRRPPENVRFYIQDVEARLPYEDHTFHVVHIRTLALAVENWTALLSEVARVLVPGGIILSGEFEPNPVLRDGEPYPPDLFPNTTEFFSHIQEMLPDKRVHAARVREHLEANGGYQNIVKQQLYVPVGRWPQDDIRQEVGQIMLDSFSLYLDSFRVAFLDRGWTVQEYDDLEHRAYREVEQVPGSCLVYNAVHAVRV